MKPYGSPVATEVRELVTSESGGSPRTRQEVNLDHARARVQPSSSWRAIHHGLRGRRRRPRREGTASTIARVMARSPSRCLHEGCTRAVVGVAAGGRRVSANAWPAEEVGIEAVAVVVGHGCCACRRSSVDGGAGRHRQRGGTYANSRWPRRPRRGAVPRGGAIAEARGRGARSRASTAACPPWVMRAYCTDGARHRGAMHFTVVCTCRGVEGRVTVMRCQ